MSDRLAAARAYVAGRPTDRFGLYALAMELRKIGEWAECWATFDRLLEHHPDYGAAYYHYGMARREGGDRPGGVTILKRGRTACASTGDTKTGAEIDGVLDELGEA